MERSSEALLIEIGCEEIPARMIRAAALELGRIVARALDQAGLDHGATRTWGGARRLAVRVDDVPSREADREEVVLGPPAAAARGADGALSPAAAGFARKHGIDPAQLQVIEGDRGSYLGFRRQVAGQTLVQVLGRQLPQAVAAMSFPKTMRWGGGEPRWVRPVHWLVVLHGPRVLPLELLGLRAGAESRGHRFLDDRPVRLEHPAGYVEVLEAAHVLVDSAARSGRIAAALKRAATELDGELIDDPELLAEVSELVEWPGVVTGRFDPGYLELPWELLTTTLRHHQKCFAARDDGGRLLPAFFAVANTDRDPAGHIRRGNEWVVGGRLEDARFFWREDRRLPLEALSPKLAGLVFHRRAGTYADKARRIGALAQELARGLGWDSAIVEACRRAAELSKNDLVSGTVGEFPELQGRVGGLLLEAEGAGETVARAVYEHYRPAGPGDELPRSPAGRIVSIADKLDTVAELLRAGERPSGSKDPLGLRRAGNGIVRILLDATWSITLDGLARLAGGDPATLQFLRERAEAVLRDSGFTVKEILAVTRPRVDAEEANGWPLPDISARLEALRRVRHREDFRHLVKLTERVDNIVAKNEATIRDIAESADRAAAVEPQAQAEQRLAGMLERHAAEMQSAAERKCYDDVVQSLSEFINPVERFFDDCLVIDPTRPQTTRRRYELLVGLMRLFTRYFDIRELAGEAEGSTQ